MIYLIVIVVVCILAYNFFKSGTAKGTIKVTEDSYWKLKRSNPGLDEHQYLASVYKHRRNISSKLGKTNNVDQELLDTYSYSLTYLFSILPPPDSIRALALHIIYQENPQDLQKSPELISEYNKLTEPVHKLLENNPERFIDEYKKRNPNTSSFFDIEQEIQNLDNKGDIRKIEQRDESYNQKQFNQQTQLTKDQLEAYDIGMLQCMISIAIIDGNLEQNEIDMIAIIYESSWKKSADKDQIRNLANNMMKNGFHDVFNIADIHHYYDVEMRKDIIKAGYMVAFADGDISESEKNRLIEIANAIKITDVQIKEAFDEVNKMVSSLT